jgi:hypothetical protein
VKLDTSVAFASCETDVADLGRLIDKFGIVMKGLLV